MARSDGEACVQVFFVRGGKLIGREYFILEGTEDTADNEVLEHFITQFYTEAANVPEQVMLPHQLEEARIISQWLRRSRGGEKVEFFVPTEGQLARPCPNGSRECHRDATSLSAQWQADTHKQETALAELRAVS